MYFLVPTLLPILPLMAQKDIEAMNPRVVIEIVSINEDIPRLGPNPPSMVQITPNGRFLTSDGDPFKDEKQLSVYFSQTRSSKKGNLIHLWVHLTDEKGTAIPILLTALGKLRKAAPPNTNAVIFVRFNSLPPMVNQSKKKGR
jgi:hypothetical protein